MDLLRLHPRTLYKNAIKMSTYMLATTKNELGNLVKDLRHNEHIFSPSFFLKIYEWIEEILLRDSHYCLSHVYLNADST